MVVGMDGWLHLIRLAFTVAICAWMTSAMFLSPIFRHRINPDGMALRVARWIFHELKPFIRFMTIARFGIHCLDLSPTLWVHAGVLGLDLWNYYMYKDQDDDDDRWKRRKQKVLDKITITDGKLAVIPA